MPCGPSRCRAVRWGLPCPCPLSPPCSPAPWPRHPDSHTGASRFPHRSIPASTSERPGSHTGASRFPHQSIPAPTPEHPDSHNRASQLPHRRIPGPWSEHPSSLTRASWLPHWGISAPTPEHPSSSARASRLLHRSILALWPEHPGSHTRASWLPSPAGHALCFSSTVITCVYSLQTHEEHLTLGKKCLRSYFCPYLSSLFKLLFNCFLINVKDRGW